MFKRVGSQLDPYNMPALDKLDFDKTVAAGLATKISRTNWSTIFSLNDNIERAWEKFSSHIMKLVVTSKNLNLY